MLNKNDENKVVAIYARVNNYFGEVAIEKELAEQVKVCIDHAISQGYSKDDLKFYSDTKSLKNDSKIPMNL